MEVSAQQLHLYRTFGFLKFPGLFADDVDRITGAFEELWAASGRTHDHQKRSMLMAFIDQHDYLSSLLDDPRIESVASAILGDDFNYEGSDGNYYVGDTKWHSDHNPSDHIDSFKIAFYLDPVTRDTGCLRVIPGSIHGGDPFTTMLHEAVPFTTSSRPEEFWGVSGGDVPAYAIESQPGDMLLFNHKLKHSSWGGGDRRRMFTLNLQQRFTAADLPRLREEIAAVRRSPDGAGPNIYGDAILRTAGPRRMRHLEQRLAIVAETPAG